VAPEKARRLTQEQQDEWRYLLISAICDKRRYAYPICTDDSKLFELAPASRGLLKTCRTSGTCYPFTAYTLEVALDILFSPSANQDSLQTSTFQASNRYDWSWHESHQKLCCERSSFCAAKTDRVSIRAREPGRGHRLSRGRTSPSENVKCSPTVWPSPFLWNGIHHSDQSLDQF
jgi:hypothetical protein